MTQKICDSCNGGGYVLEKDTYYVMCYDCKGSGFILVKRSMDGEGSDATS